MKTKVIVEVNGQKFGEGDAVEADNLKKKLIEEGVPAENIILKSKSILLG